MHLAHISLHQTPAHSGFGNRSTDIGYRFYNLLQLIDYKATKIGWLKAKITDEKNKFPFYKWFQMFNVHTNRNKSTNISFPCYKYMLTKQCVCSKLMLVLLLLFGICLFHSFPPSFSYSLERCVYGSFIVQCAMPNVYILLHTKLSVKLRVSVVYFYKDFSIVCIKPTLKARKKRLTGSGIVSNVCLRHRASVSFGKY